MAYDKCENLEAFPPFPELEDVLAMDTGEPEITTSADTVGETVDDVTKSITIYG